MRGREGEGIEGGHAIVCVEDGEQLMGVSEQILPFYHSLVGFQGWTQVVRLGDKPIPQ